jgi:hypothetical protein
MNRDEAAREAARLAEENPGRRWLPREGDDGEWAVAEIKLPAGMKPNPPLKETVEQKPKPPQADDVRPAHDRNVGGPYGF